TFGREARGDDILKYRLYQEQDCLCPYSGEPIKPKDLKDPNALQIDHIIPYARSWNDSQANKILTFTKYNQEKGDNTPYEKWGATERWETIEALAENLPPKKKHNVLIKEFDEDDFKSRHLVNTGYIARALLAHVEKHLDLPPIVINGQEKKQRVQSRNGQLTAKLRGLWGVNNIYKPDAASQGDDNNDAKEKEKGATKKDRSHDRHHIVDAIVIACSTQSMVQAASNWNRHNARMLRQEKEKARKSATGEVRMDFYAKAPWPNFRDDVKKFINSPDLFISRQPVRTITGEGHEATVKSLRTDADGNRLKSVKKLSLTRADKNTITGWKKSFANNDDKNPFNNMVDEVEQQKRYENKQSKQRHSKIYLAIKERLEKTPDEELKNAFEKPLYLPSAPGRVAPIIRSVRIYDNSVSGIAVRGGIADNGAHARLDIFGMVETKGKNKGNMQFYLVPCFNHQVNRRDAAGNPTLPDEYLPYKNGRGEKLTPNHQFLFSLFKG
ncbi:MAG: type II CRISPR RNA-guided endonuclease Cas9, partial [Alphaproteobacteria bacterium]|nr:type II CRISPR RNA-guided endonuclease Cas9 [Alphaproteobacteria bacterium]